jgi:hypothetical protein
LSTAVRRQFFDVRRQARAFGCSKSRVAGKCLQFLSLSRKIEGNEIGSTVFNSRNVYPSTYDAAGRRYAVSAKLKF